MVPTNPAPPPTHRPGPHALARLQRPGGHALGPVLARVDPAAGRRAPQPDREQILAGHREPPARPADLPLVDEMLSLGWGVLDTPDWYTPLDGTAGPRPGGHTMSVVLITGAASGLGWALARAGHARGDQLLLTDIEGLSHTFERGFVTYSRDAKGQMLGVDRALIERFGAVSAAVARAMAVAAAMVVRAARRP